MKITWIGQAGLLFEEDGFKIMIDPYLSDSVEKINPKSYRRVAVDERFLNIVPDVMIFTHDHLDHYDTETAPVFLNNKSKTMTVLAPTSVWGKARAHGTHNYVEFNTHTEWTEGNFRFTAVKAVHSDHYAIGVLIESLKDGSVYYATGDTLYSEEIFADLPERIDMVFLPINGVGNNMNVADACRFAQKTGAKKAVPLHFGMFDEIDPQEFVCENRIIPKMYSEIE